MYSLEKWTHNRCRIMGAASKLDHAKEKADSDAKKELEWVEQDTKLIALDGHVHYEIRLVS